MEVLFNRLLDIIVANLELLDAVLALSGLIVYVVASHTLHQRRHPSAAIAWVLGILIFPYLVLPLYLTFGRRKLVATRPSRARPFSLVFPPNLPATTVRTRELSLAMGLPSPAPYSAFCVHRNGAASLSALWQIIDSATCTLDVSTFIFGRDMLGNKVARKLKERAEAGVRVRLLIDGVGIYMGGLPDITGLKEAGVQVVRFVPPFSSNQQGRTNLRNHRKMVVADGVRVWFGGRNLAAEYFDLDAGARDLLKHAPWVDLTVSLEGAVVAQVQACFEKDWCFATEADAVTTQSSVNDRLDFPPALNFKRSAQLIDSGPDRTDDTILTILVSACFTAQQRILAVTPYFVPEPSLLVAMTLAARRGLDVDLVLPARSNHRLADFARHRSLRELVLAGGRVWLHPQMVHAKAVIVDEDLALVGSANLDGRSLFLNYEMMMALYETSAVVELANWVEERRVVSSAYTVHRPHVLREVAEGLILWLAFQL